jgi:hypothetical protein
MITPAFETPLSTVWPAILAAGVLVLGLLLSRRSLRLPRGWIAVASAALFVRLVVIPALTAHTYDGHEADYFDIFRGIAEPTRGGTVKVPAMQWFWWLIGQPFSGVPSDHALLRTVPVLVMAAISVVAIGALAGAIGLLSGRRAGWFAAAFLVVHPVHALWSSSAYNVMLPHALGCVALLAVARIASRTGPPGALAWVAAGAGALSVGMRLDTATVGLALIGTAVLIRPKDVGAGQRLRSLLLPGLTGLVLAALAIWPMVWPGQLPGAGERELAFQINLGLLDFYAPFHTWLGLGLLGLLSLLTVRAHPRVGLALLPLAVVHHLIMASFDDFGARHTLPALIPIAFVVGAGCQALPRWGWAALLVPLGLAMHQTHEQAGRYYGDEASYRATLEAPPHSALARWQWPSDVPADCGWVVEDHRVRRGPVRSHFNLLQPSEVAQLRGSAGCLLWCKDVQDWRWSSRGVSDRAQRLEHLYELEPVAVVVEPNSGYACLAMQVGPRRIGH